MPTSGLVGLRVRENTGLVTWIADPAVVGIENELTLAYALTDREDRFTVAPKFT